MLKSEEPGFKKYPIQYKEIQLGTELQHHFL